MGVTSSWSPLGNFLEGQVHLDKRIFKIYGFVRSICKRFLMCGLFFLYVDDLLHCLMFNFSLISVVKFLSRVFLCLLSSSSVFLTKVIVFVFQ